MEQDILKVSEIFYSIQGEGEFVGTPAVFIRFFGCNLNCPWCDTKYAVNEYHPTQKPIALAAKAIKNHDVRVVLDVFGGSGSTLIACEQLNRICYMMEIDPVYCDVIVKRWEEYTGKKAELLR